jgi:hypothetical protein
MGSAFNDGITRHSRLPRPSAFISLWSAPRECGLPDLGSFSLIRDAAL